MIKTASFVIFMIASSPSFMRPDESSGRSRPAVRLMRNLPLGRPKLLCNDFQQFLPYLSKFSSSEENGAVTDITFQRDGFRVTLCICSRFVLIASSTCGVAAFIGGTDKCLRRATEMHYSPMTLTITRLSR
jgi:hypothetical protein